MPYPRRLRALSLALAAAVCLAVPLGAARADTVPEQGVWFHNQPVLVGDTYSMSFEVPANEQRTAQLQRLTDSGWEQVDETQTYPFKPTYEHWYADFTAPTDATWLTYHQVRVVMPATADESAYVGAPQSAPIYDAPTVGHLDAPDHGYVENVVPASFGYPVDVTYDDAPADGAWHCIYTRMVPGQWDRGNNSECEPADEDFVVSLHEGGNAQRVVLYDNRDDAIRNQNPVGVTTPATEQGEYGPWTPQQVPDQQFQVGEEVHLQLHTLGDLDGTWSITPGGKKFNDAGLPSGLSLNPRTGLISGVAKDDGDWSWLSIDFKPDGRDFHTVVDFDIQVSLRPQDPDIPPAMLGVEPHSYQSFFTVLSSDLYQGVRVDAPPWPVLSDGPVTSWKVVKGRLPYGIHLDPDSGRIFGVPQRSRDVMRHPTIRASNDAGGYDDEYLVDRVAPTSDPEIATTSLPVAHKGQWYRADLALAPIENVHGTPIPDVERAGSWKLVKGRLPAGLKLTSDGVLEGHPHVVTKRRITVRFVELHTGRRDPQALDLIVRP
ncbi:Ig domain-containing protein [Nocardioides acrostichi]|uniref:Ig domain-containing protein n=1 Tax=Nocardioides acrostichi TaxID=2784339 RepID=A0A930UYS0_9ACTN|nr:Ig domain-containing protein [Nocardioides acrostichi]MBF4161530.1 putative Ig domain-containing protein [Nocardioides acrostichi]